MKFLCEIITFILLLPIFIFYYFFCWILGHRRAFADFSQMMSLIPGIFGEFFRRVFYRTVLPRCEKNSCISFGVIFSHPTAEIGENVYIGPYCILGDITLEKDVLLASGVSVANGTKQHGTRRLDIPIREQPGEYPRIIIGEDSWVGERATVLANIGKHCIIGAGSLVVEPIPDYAIAVGVPAKVIKFRNQAE
ncbi:MAG: acyltransferase [Planctomycetia bacterium]|nr:acyltransferase [Planctomycetia bacterium]